jgi:hypothetical protein
MAATPAKKTDAQPWTFQPVMVTLEVCRVGAALHPVDAPRPAA